MSKETVARYRRLPRFYDLKDLEKLAIRLRRRRSHLSTIYKAARGDPRFHPFDNLFLLSAICRRIRRAGRILSRLEVRAALKVAYDPAVHDEAERLLLTEVESTPRRPSAPLPAP